MRTLQDWRYIARKMRMLGYATEAIQCSIAKLGFDVGYRSLLRVLNLETFHDTDLPSGYQDFVANGWNHDPPRRFVILEPLDILQSVLRYETAGQSLTVTDSPKNGVIVGEKTQETRISDQVEFAEEPTVYAPEGFPLDSFSVWAGDNHKSALRRYLDYERRSNKSMSDISSEEY